MKKVVIAVMVICTVFAISIFANAAAKPGFDDKEIRIGQWGPQTGPAAPWGSVARGSGLLFNVVNEQGGIHGRKIKYFIRDDQYNPAQTKAVVKELVEREGVFAFVGGVGGACGLAVMNYLAENKVIWVGPSAAISDFVFPVKPYLFAVYPFMKTRAASSRNTWWKSSRLKKLLSSIKTTPMARTGLKGPRKGSPPTR